MTKANDPTYATTDGQAAAPGFENAPTPKSYGPSGQAEAYWVLSEAYRLNQELARLDRASEGKGGNP